ncbi:MAG: metal ABC transporter substrate-binding protein [Alcanivoracaceae bacterium]
MTRTLLILLLTIVSSQVQAQAQARLNVVATVSNMAMLASTVGGDQVQVTTLAPPDRDAHHLEVRPAMMVALRQADLVVAVGAELEIGWLPPAIQGAKNPRINPGQPAHFEAAVHVTLIDPVPDANRSMGDVHADGNPHVYLDPVRMTVIAHALADSLAALRPEFSDHFHQRAEAFAKQVEDRLPAWRHTTTAAPGVLLFHADANYLARLFSVPVHGYLEPVPGIPPSGRHLANLTRALRGQQGVLIMPMYQPRRNARLVESELGWPVYQLPTQVPLNGSADDYLALIDRWADAMAGTQ